MVIEELAADDLHGIAVDSGGSFLDGWQCLNPFLANKNIA
jgi:hypothetical protein